MGFFQKLRLYNKKLLTVKFIELPLKIDFFTKKRTFNRYLPPLESSLYYYIAIIFHYFIT